MSGAHSRRKGAGFEREGILEARVVSLRGTNPTLELPVKADWGPDVFVSVMPVRGSA